MLQDMGSGKQIVIMLHHTTIQLFRTGVGSCLPTVARGLLVVHKLVFPVLFTESQVRVALSVNKI